MTHVPDVKDVVDVGAQAPRISTTATEMADAAGEAEAAAVMTEDLNTPQLLAPERLKGFQTRAEALLPRVQTLLSGNTVTEIEGLKGKFPTLLIWPASAQKGAIEVVAVSEYSDHLFTIIYNPDGDITFIRDQGGFQRVKITKSGVVEPSSEMRRDASLVLNEAGEIAEETLAALEGLIPEAEAKVKG